MLLASSVVCIMSKVKTKKPINLTDPLPYTPAWMVDKHAWEYLVALPHHPSHRLKVHSLQLTNKKKCGMLYMKVNTHIYKLWHMKCG